jgi:hypothetical protein
MILGRLKVLFNFVFVPLYVCLLMLLFGDPEDESATPD